MGKSPALMRLDALLVKRGLALSREHAQELIDDGHVLVNGLTATKSAMRVKTDLPVRLKTKDRLWVGRGALKLLGALEPFKVDPKDCICADFGSSTGGFTQVLLHRGAKKVYAIDVGRGQLDWKLRTHAQVIVMEETNVRHLESLPEAMDLIVGDLSFISLKLILPTVAKFLRPGGEAVLLIKPQFEVRRDAVEKGGLVRSKPERSQAIERILQDARNEGFTVLNGADCTVPGAKAGNVEYFTHLRWDPPS